MGISAIILTRDNQDVISGVIAGVRFADEILVIDDGSTDKTRELAKKAGASVYRHPVHDDFAAQRNYALTKAKGPWVLFVDADETVSDALAGEIRKAVSRMDVSGFYVRRQDTMWGRVLKYGETDNVRLLRLGKIGAGVWRRPVHEVWDIRGVVATLEHPLLHTPHPDVAQFLADVNRYSTINANYLADHGTRVHVWQILAYPIAKFFQNYFARQGFRDGMPGMIVAVMMSFHSFLTRAKLWQLSHASSR